MNKEETVKILMIRRAAYSVSKSADDLQNEMEVEIWQKSFADYDYKTVSAALMHCIQTRDYIPQIKNVKDAVIEITEPELADNGLEAFSEFRRVLSSPNKKDDYDALNDATRAITSFSDVRELSISSPEYITNFYKPAFLKNYKAYMETKKQEKANPVSLQTAISCIRSEMQIAASSAPKKIDMD